MRFAYGILAALMAVGGASAAPTVANIGDGTLDASRLQPYDNAFVVRQIYPDGRVVFPGIWTDQLRLRDSGGQQRFVRTQSLGYFDGRIVSSVNVFDAKTFAPVSDLQSTPDGGHQRWTFTGSHVEGHLTPGGPNAAEQVIGYDTATPFFDLNCCMRSILGAMLSPGALRPGYSVSISANEGSVTTDTVVLTVIRKEKVRAGARGMVDAWLVETPLFGGFIHFWIGDTAPYLIRMTLSANTVSPYYQTFDMIAPGDVTQTPPIEEGAFPAGSRSP